MCFKLHAKPRCFVPKCLEHDRYYLKCICKDNMKVNQHIRHCHLPIVFQSHIFYGSGMSGINYFARRDVVITLFEHIIS